MKSISNTTRQIALVIMLLILVMIMSTFQGGNKGTDIGPATRSGNPGRSADLAVPQADNTIRGTGHLLSDCEVCHEDRDATGITVAVSLLITIPAISPLDSTKVEANP